MASKIFSALLSICCLSACGAAETPIAAPIAEASAPFGKLPEGAHPLSYTVALQIDPRETVFRGTVRLEVWLDQPSDGFWLHGDDLRVQAVRAAGKPATYEEVLNATGVSRIIFEDVEPAGQVDVEIVYEADFDRNLAGLFRVEEQGEAYALAKSESIQARRFLPGFDEPGYKAPFDITLIVPEGYEAISNTPEIDRRAAEEDGFEAVRFNTTRPLSTYLLSVAVGPFDIVEYPDIAPNDIREVPIPLRGIARKGRGDDLRRALDTTAELVEIFETAIAQPYPYQKLDIVAAPAWPSGATELAGAITYRESRILLDENSGPAAYRAMLGIHTHELAHMWFGNLVTPPWWDDLWLKEAFATWGTPLALTAFEPDGGHDVDATARAIGAMGLDSLASTRAVREDIFRNENIRNAYDAITYSKGMAVIAMADAYFGAETFRPALGEYIAQYADAAADSPDFYDVIGEVTGEPAMTEVFRSFVEQQGVPRLKTEMVCNVVDGAGSSEARPIIRVSQDRYRPLGSAIETGTLWTIPVCIAYGDGQGGRDRTCTIVREQKVEIDLGVQGDCPQFFLPNDGGSGYFRWSMSDGDWSNLLASFDMLTAAEALSALDSAVSSFESGEGNAIVVMELMAKAVGHPDRRVTVAPMAALRRFQRVLADEDDRRALQDVGAKLYRPLFETVRGFDNADDRVLATQLEAFLATTAKDPEVRSNMAEDAARFLGLDGPGDRTALSSDRYAAALSVAVQDLGADFFEALVEVGGTIDDPRFGIARAIALGLAESPTEAERVRTMALEGTLGPRESFDLIRGQMRSPETREETWAWLTANFAGYVEQLPSQWRRRTPGLAADFCEAQHVDDLTTLFDEVGDLAPGHQRALSQTSESIELCAALRSERADDLAEALNWWSGLDR